MLSFTYPDGRIVVMTQFKIVGTYRGQLEGSPKSLSECLRRDVARRGKTELPPGEPLAVVMPPAGKLPPWMCIAEFESVRGVKHGDPDYNSILFVCWFTDDLSQPIDQLIKQPLSQVDWEQQAEDYSVMDF